MIKNKFRNPKCFLSRAIILTGRNSWQLEDLGGLWPCYPLKVLGISGGLQYSRNFEPARRPVNQGF